jgi:hypothetical protein
VRQGKGAWEDNPEQQEEMLFNFGLMDLLDAFKKVLKNAPSGHFHEISGESISITDKINRISSCLKMRGITFESIFDGASSTR